MLAATRTTVGIRRPSPGDRSARALGLATAGLLAVDGLGGSLAVASGWNTAAEAWGSRAVAAAPVPMMAAQIALAAAAVRWPGRRGAVAAGVLAGVCGISGLSGFFDGQFGKHGLPRTLLAVQVMLVASTLGVAALAVVRARRLLRAGERDGAA
jgi:hypothetical protein